jgi:hypothetical protein
LRNPNNEIRDTRFVELSVQDTGVGISPDEIANLFQKYRQSSSGQTSEHKGTGLGLVISKIIVEAHGGKIWVESEEGKGTTFTSPCRSIPNANPAPVAILGCSSVERKDPDMKIRTGRYRRRVPQQPGVFRGENKMN